MFLPEFFAQTLFQSASMGVVSLIDDRENDFSQEVFVSPISRYTIILGKILGETLVAMTQALGILVFGFLAGVRFLFCTVDWFGLVRHSDLFVRRSFWSDHTLEPEQPADSRSSFSLYHATAILFGWCVYPIRSLPWYLDFLSRISPMRYAVDLTCDIFYVGRTDYVNAVLQGPAYNLTLMTVAFLVFLFIGTFLFVRKEQNR